MAVATDNPWLTGLHAPVEDEIEAPDLPVSGHLPRALRGAYVRNGPNAAFAPLGRYHLFDGDGMLHAVALRDGRASYRNRWIETAGLLAERRAGRALYGGLANPQAPDPEQAGDAGPVKNVANTHVVRHAGRILCLWEAGPPTQVDESLATLGPFDFGGRLEGPMTAHPKIDPETGELVFFGYSAIPPFLRFHVADAKGELVRSVPLDLPRPVMIHDFAVTRHHAVFLDAPAVFDFESFAAGGPILTWRPDLEARIGVLPRDGDAGDVIWCDVPPCYVFHFLNAYEEGRAIHVDACRLASLEIGLEGDRPAHAESFLGRFTVDLDAREARFERIAELPGDFPRIPDARAGLPYRYGYVASFASGKSDGGFFDSIVRYDLERGETVAHRFGPGRVTGEAVFAPDPDGRDEQDGWLLSFVYDAARDTSDLVVLDARDLAAEPVARVHLPRRVPFGFHGSWMPTEA